MYLSTFGVDLRHLTLYSHWNITRMIFESNYYIKIDRIEIHRHVLNGPYIRLINLWTQGELYRRLKAHSEKLFHYSLWLQLSNGKKISLEKSPMINFEENPIHNRDEILEIPCLSYVTFGELLEKSHIEMGNNFFSYSVENNNCGNFIESILKANGLNKFLPESFIRKNISDIFDGLNVTKLIDDIVFIVRIASILFPASL